MISFARLAQLDLEWRAKLTDCLIDIKLLLDVVFGQITLNIGFVRPKKKEWTK
jgi:hypothetical protein